MIIFSLVLALIFPRGKAFCQEIDTVFYSGFEEGNKDIWDDRDPNPDSTNLLMLHPGPFDTPGNHVMRLRVPPGRGAADIVKELPGSYDKLYLRWYQMWEDGYDFSAKNHGSGLHAGNRNYLGVSGRMPRGNDWFSTWLEPIEGRLNLYTYYRGMYMDCVDPNGRCWGDHFPCWLDEGEHICEKEEHRERIMPPLMVSGKWYCLEIMIEGGTPVQNDEDADGSLNFWIDGVEYGPWEHLWFRTTENLKLNILWFDLFHHEEHSVEGIMLDEIVVSTDYVGCGGPDRVENNDPAGEVNLEIVQNSGMIVLKYNLEKREAVFIKIHDILGNTVCSLFKRDLAPGTYQDYFDENVLIQGIYFYSIRIGPDTYCGKLLFY